MKDDFKEEQYISDVKYYKYRSAIAKFRISTHTFQLKRSVPSDQRVYPLSLGSMIDDEKHYIFRCTNDKLAEIRKDFAKELFESNLQSCFNDRCSIYRTYQNNSVL